MRNVLVLLATIVLAGASVAPVRAQWNDYGYNGTVVRCESRDGRVERCSTYGREVELVRQFSNTPCVRGNTWGTDSRGIWVSGGCRGEFRVHSGYDDRYDDDRYGYGYGNDDRYGYGYGNDGTFRCESREGRTEYCRSPGGRAQFVRQLSNSPCIRGQTWGNDSRGVWVSGGCRALFRTGYGNDGHYGGGYYGGYGNDVVRCESRDNRSRSCPMSVGRRDAIRLIRQLSDKPCIEGQTWGQTRSGVWVTQGCRAEFATTRRDGRPGGPGGNPYPPGYPPPGG
jgi:hypothetical protein